MSTTLGYAVHSIMLKSGEVPANTVTEFDDEVYAELLKLGAVRKPTPDQAKLHAASKAPAPAPVDPEREALAAEAAALGIKFNKNASAETLRERIEDAKAKAKPVAPVDDKSLDL